MSVYDHQISTSSSILTVPTPITLHQAPDDLACHNIPSVLDRRGGPSDSMRPVASRKRSRDEAAINLNDDEPLVPTPIETIQESEEDWIYGEGMVLIKPGSGYVADASSQSGTWVEEKAAEEVARRNAEAAAKAQAQMYSERPILRSHKSQRLEQGNQGPDALSNFSTPLSAPSDISAMLTPAGSDTPCPPVIDDFTLHLGIGWRRISDDDHIQAAARGWARYIENHYPLSGVLIRLESKGLQSYLVESAEGFYLFSEDLKQGRLVSKTAQGALVNLGTSPPAFEGSGTIMAAESPKPLEVPLEAAELYRTDFEMDMS